MVEEVLPRSFGGAPMDYQFIEDELPNGLPRVRLLVSPRVGEFDAGQVSDAVIAFLNQVPGASDRFGERWREAGTLEVVRAEPIATSASKVLALHTAKPKRERVA